MSSPGGSKVARPLKEDWNSGRGLYKDVNVPIRPGGRQEDGQDEATLNKKGD